MKITFEDIIEVLFIIPAFFIGLTLSYEIPHPRWYDTYDARIMWMILFTLIGGYGAGKLLIKYLKT